MCNQKRREAQNLFQQASSLLNQDKGIEAVRKARSAARKLGNTPEGIFNLASILVDVSDIANKPRYAKEAIQKLTDIEDRVPASLVTAYHYNLGNAYSAIGCRERGIGPGTRPSLTKAISHYDEVLTNSQDARIRTNLARCFLATGRYVEAFDESSIAIDEEPDLHNAVALRGSCLIGLYRWTNHHEGLLIGALADCIRAEQLAEVDLPSALSYRVTIENLRRRGVEEYYPSQKSMSSDQAWIWQERLGLNFCPICMAESPGAFDLYPLAARIEAPGRITSTLDTIELFNAVCRSYSTARWCLYKADCETPRETDHVISLVVNEGSKHDLLAGLTMAALSGFYSVLGQVSFGVNSYFRLGHTPEEVTFERIWRPRGSVRGPVPSAREDLHPKLTRYPCSALSALHGLAKSINVADGRYRQLRDLRNRIEHHIVIPSTQQVESKLLVSVDPDELKLAAFRMARIAKAAIWYFGGAVLNKERTELKRAMRRGHAVNKGFGRSVDRF